MRRLLIIALALGACSSPNWTVTMFGSEAIAVGGEDLIVWIAADPDTRRQGLMGIEELPDGVDGMLFAYEDPAPVSFHMRNTPMALDIWWFDSGGRLVGSAEMEPCTTEPCTSYRSPGPVGWALETPVGRFDFETGAVISTVESP